MRTRNGTRWRCWPLGCGALPLFAAAALGQTDGDLSNPGYQHEIVQFAIAALGFFSVLAWIRRERHGFRFERIRIAILVLAAIAAAASYYNFGRIRHAGGFKVTDVYHYYMGSKYQAEVGYFGLYDCTLAALLDNGVITRFDLPAVRSQETLALMTPDEALARSRACRDIFVPTRWHSFRRDILWFTQRMDEEEWERLVRDHGYNPTPVWSLIGGATTAVAPLGSTAFALLIQVDRLLIAASMLAIGWAFGIETAALALLVWGTSSHWGYDWIGDAMLRNLWLASVLIGISLLKRGMSFPSGALLALASLLRIFPAIFVFGFLAHSLVTFRREGRIPREATHFIAGAALCSALLLVATAWFGAGGIEAFPAFADKISSFAGRQNLNELGLSSFLWRVVLYLSGDLSVNEAGHLIVAAAPSLLETSIIRGVQLAVVVAAVVVFFRALPRLAAWEAAALAAALIPLVSNPANYYYGFVLVFSMLGSRRFALRVVLITGALAWTGNALIFHHVPAEYLGASIVAVALSLATLYFERHGSVRVR